MKFTRPPFVALFLCSLLARPAFAATENEQAAQAAFDEALKLMKSKRYAEACAHLARSQELDPAMGTQFRLAECYEKLGRYASAYDQYMSVADAAKADKQIQRESVARTRASTIETKVARLTIDISSSVASLPGVEIRRDGLVVSKASWGQAVTIDLGDHVVTVSAPNRLPFERKFWADASAKLVVSVAALDSKKGADVKPRSKIPVFVMGGAGVVGVGLGITFFALRSSRMTGAQALSAQIIADSGNCRADGQQEFAAKCASLLTKAKQGDTFGTVSIVSFAVGGAALLGMGTYLLWPDAKPRDESALRILPVFGSNMAGLSATGVF
jgi:tetratricopeptide (TPR) repeat protein